MSYIDRNSTSPVQGKARETARDDIDEFPCWRSTTFTDETTLTNKVDELLDEGYITVTGKGKGEVFIDHEMEAIHFPCVLFRSDKEKRFFVLDRFGFADIRVLGFRFPIPSSIHSLIERNEGFSKFLKSIEKIECF